MEFILFTEHAELHSSKRLLEEAAKANLSIKTINPYQEKLNLSHPIQSNLKGKTIISHRTTGIRYGDYDLRISADLQNKGAYVFNSPDVFMRIRNKESQAVFLHGQQIPIIPSYSFRDRPDHETVSKIVESFKNFLPNDSFIIKATRGNQGIGVNLIRGTQSLYSILETFWAIKDQKFIIQPYFEERSEFRLLISKNKILGALRRDSNHNDFRRNSGRGKAIKLAENELPNEVRHLGIKAFQSANPLYAAIDLLKWKDHIFVIEINLVPGFKQMEEMTGRNHAKEIVLDAVSMIEGGDDVIYL